MAYNSSLGHLQNELRAGRVAKLRPLPGARKDIDSAIWALSTWEPVVLAACEYFDTVTSGLDATEQHTKLLAVIRREMETHKL